MKRLTYIIVLAIAYISPTLASERSCEFRKIEQLAKKFVFEFHKNNLASLDSKLPYKKDVQVIIDHSLTGEYEVEELSSFKEVEEWLKRLEPEPGFPDRRSRPVLWCKKGLCLFDFSEGLAHNSLFPKVLIYGYENNCPYVKTVIFIHGD